MNRWRNIDQTPAGRPTLTEGETILFVQNSVGLYDGYLNLMLFCLITANLNLLITKMGLSI